MLTSRLSTRCEAVVLKSFKSGDADRIVIFFTKRFGKLKGLMKSARKSKSRFRAAAEIGSIVNLSLYYKDREMEIGRVTDIDSIEPLATARQDYTRILVINYLMNIIDEAWQVNDAHPECFDLLSATLNRLEQAKDHESLPSLVHGFELRVLMYLGIHPSLTICVSCGRDQKTDVRFDLRSLSSHCPHCNPSRNSALSVIPLNPEFVSFYKECTETDHPLPLHLLSKEVDRQSRIFFRKIFLNYLGRHLNVLKVMEAIRK